MTEPGVVTRSADALQRHLWKIAGKAGKAGHRRPIRGAVCVTMPRRPARNIQH